MHCQRIFAEAIGYNDITGVGESVVDIDVERDLGHEVEEDGEAGRAGGGQLEAGLPRNNTFRASASHYADAADAIAAMRRRVPLASASPPWMQWQNTTDYKQQLF